MNLFESLNEWIRDAESSIVNFLSVFAPWLAPIVPAYMTFQHATNVLGFPFLVALAAAVLVEILGFSAVSTFLAFWFYNRRNQAQTKRAPVEVIVFAFFFYLALIVSTNVLLDTFPGEKWAEIAVRALFTLQTIPAALIIAVRTQHKELLSEIERERSRKLSERQQKVSEGEQKLTENFPTDWRKLRPLLSDSDVANIASMDSDQVKALSLKYHVDIRTVTNWRTYARRELGMVES